MHIGLLEDDAQQMSLLQLWLESAQHSHHGSLNAKAFRESFGSQHYDAVLVDWMLPDGLGSEVIQWVRQEQGWGLPVIVVTSRDDEATVVSALRSGADDYLVKPVKPMELLARISC